MFSNRIFAASARLHNDMNSVPVGGIPGLVDGAQLLHPDLPFSQFD
jgi:hypothetical protein